MRKSPEPGAFSRIRNAGKTINAREQQMLDDARTGEEDIQPGKKTGFAQNWGDLADRLKRSRRCLTKWRERFKDAPDLPKERDDGRHDVNAWLRFMVAHDLQDEPEEELGEEVPSKAHWDRLRAKIGYEREVFGFETDRLKHIEVAEISGAVGQMLAGFRTALNNLPASAARWVIGLRDFHQVKDKLQSEVDAVLQSLGRCEYLENLIPEVVAKMYADRDEQFRGNLIECADGVLRELGRLALSDLLQRSLPQSAESTSRSADSAKIEDHIGEQSTDATPISPAEITAPTAPLPSPKPRAKKRGGK